MKKTMAEQIESSIVLNRRTVNALREIWLTHLKAGNFDKALKVEAFVQEFFNIDLTKEKDEKP